MVYDLQFTWFTYFESMKGNNFHMEPSDIFDQNYFRQHENLTSNLLKLLRMLRSSAHKKNSVR